MLSFVQSTYRTLKMNTIQNKGPFCGPAAAYNDCTSSLRPDSVDSLQYAQNCGQYTHSFCMTGYIFSPLHDSEYVCLQVMT